MCSVSSNEKVRSLRYVTTLDKIRNEDGNKCIYDKRKKGTTEKINLKAHKRTEDSSIVGYYSLHNPEERSSNKRLVF